MTPRTSRTRQDEQDDENILISYRMGKVEKALDNLTSRFDKQDNIKKSDLMELRDTIVSRITDIQTGLQKQIDAKASSQELKDFKKQVYAVAAFVGALVVTAFSYMLTRLK